MLPAPQLTDNDFLALTVRYWEERRIAWDEIDIAVRCKGKVVRQALLEPGQIKVITDAELAAIRSAALAAPG